ncbi:hypothetical protein CCYS_11785 [Corynebacterium cystitidis DSM 20524]|nr:hypothetical protein CCYS_11785 [Corynebacterium cystitidis DSM 20524]SNV67998.1 Uncharacterised protein [Corynebacterium cystitidis]
MASPIFTSVSGLCEVGEAHGGVLRVNGVESQRAFADRFANIAAQLRQNVADVVNADTRIGQLIDAVGLPASGGFDFFTRDHGADVVDTETAAFVMTVPVVAGVGSLSVLASQYAATNFGVPESMTGQWLALSAKVSDAVECLDGVLADLDSSSDTEAIANAMGAVRALQSAGSVFGANTLTMGAATTNLGTGSFALGQQVVMAAKAYGILLATRPDVAGVFERAFLASYPATVAAALPPSIPSITQLLPSALDPSGVSAGSGGGAFRGGDPGVGLSMWQDLPFPAVVQEAMEQVGMVEQARMRNPYELAQEFVRVGRDDLDALVAGAVPTSTASVGGPSLSPSVNPVGTVGSTPGFVVGSGTVGSGMVGGVGTGGAGVGAGAGTGASGAVGRGAVGRGAALGGVGYGSGNRGGSGVGGGVGLSGRGAGGTGGAGGSGVGSRPGLGSGVGAGPSPGVGAGPGAGSGAGATTGVGSHGRGGAPIGGMMGAGAGRAAGRGTGQQGVKSSSVRGIKTSAVERKGNLKALLGEGPEVIPGVIGAWVREPRNDR